MLILVQIFQGQPAPGSNQLGRPLEPDRSQSDTSDPDLGAAAAMEEEEVTGGRDQPSGALPEGGLESWPDDDEGMEEAPVRASQ